jgi:hypothetical protein
LRIAVSGISEAGSRILKIHLHFLKPFLNLLIHHIGAIDGDVKLAGRQASLSRQHLARFLRLKVAGGVQFKLGVEEVF